MLWNFITSRYDSHLTLTRSHTHIMHVIFHSLGGNVIRDSVESTEVIPAPLNCQYSSIRNVGFLYTNNVSKPCSIAMATTVPIV